MADELDNVVSLEQYRTAHINGKSTLDDDELIRHAGEKITAWKANGGTPSLTEAQALFFEAICAGASSMARDRIIEAIIAAFGTELGGKRAMAATWGKLATDFAAECAQDVRENTAEPELTPEQKAALRESLWPSVCELALAPDLIDRVVGQVQAMGVVGERELIVLTYLAGTSRVLSNPINAGTERPKPPIETGGRLNAVRC